MSDPIELVPIDQALIQSNSELAQVRQANAILAQVICTLIHSVDGYRQPIDHIMLQNSCISRYAGWALDIREGPPGFVIIAPRPPGPIPASPVA